MPAGSTYQDFLYAILSTVQAPHYYKYKAGEETFLKQITLSSGHSILFQVKIRTTSKEILHAYPVVGHGLTIYNPKQTGPTQVTFRPAVLGEELKRVIR